MLNIINLLSLERRNYLFKITTNIHCKVPNNCFENFSWITQIIRFFFSKFQIIKNVFKHSGESKYQNSPILKWSKVVCQLNGPIVKPPSFY